MWNNLLSLLPGTVLTVLTIAIAFLRFYDEQDFRLLGLITQPRIWSNRLTVAALVVAMVNLGVEWHRRNRETNRLAQEAQRRVEEDGRREAEAARAEAQRAEEEQRRVEEAQRRVEERERTSRRIGIETRCRIAEIRYQLDASQENRQGLLTMLAVLQEYGEVW